MKSRKKEIIILSTVIIIQTILFIIMGINKSYIHMDEAYSLGLSNYDKTEIGHNEDYYNNWHNGKYYEDYLAVDEDEIGQYKQVYENQKNDVHPPFYYLILRFAMGFSINHFSKWPGLIINIIIYIFITIFMYLILEKIFKNKEKSAILAFISAVTIASLTNVLYIRMYALSTLNILITTYLHIKLIDTEKIDVKLLSLIGISALIGSLTHYYYLFYLVMLYIMFAIKYIKHKKYKELIYYTVTMIIAGGLSLIIFPYSIKHMFFGYRGQGVISNLTNIPKFLSSIFLYIDKVNYYGFNNMLYVIIAIILLVTIYKLCKKQEIDREKNKYIKIILLPTLFYFILVAIASPWIELRYIMPICSLIFTLIIYYFYQVLSSIFKDRQTKIIVIATFIMMAIMPIICKIEPEILYINKKDIVQRVSNELNVPMIYLFNSNKDRLLDDIYLFSLLDESYIAKDIEYNEENIRNIVKEKDISNGLLIFINEDQDNEYILSVVKSALQFQECTWIKGLNACNVYYFK